MQLEVEKLSRKYAEPIHVFQSNKSRKSEPYTFGKFIGSESDLIHFQEGKAQK